MRYVDCTGYQDDGLDGLSVEEIACLAFAKDISDTGDDLDGVPSCRWARNRHSRSHWLNISPDDHSEAACRDRERLMYSVGWE